MKKLIYILTGILILNACSEDFLNRVPTDRLDLENYYTNPVEAEIGLTGAYSRIISKHMMQNIFWFTVSADEMTAANHANSGIGSGDHRDLATTSLYGMLGTYVMPYTGICNLNLLLQKVPEIPETSFAPGRKNELLGEAYFLRGYAYYMLAMVFRDVPLQLEVTTSSDPNENFMAKSPQNEVLNQAISDFDNAISLLPDKLSGMSDHDVRGRASKWAAKAFKARIYLWREQWADAVRECNDIIGSGHCTITPKWTDIFAEENDNEEVIWQSQGQSRDKYDFMGVYRWYCDADPTAPLPPFMVEAGMTAMFEKPYRDVRLEYSVRAIGRASGNANYGGRAVKHFHVPSGTILQGVTDESRDKNFPIVRLAEITLMKAEAIVQSGYTLGTQQEVLEILNELRNRAADPTFTPREPDTRYPGAGGGCTGIPVLTLAEVNLQAVKDEKKRELMFEGVRYIDLLRWSRMEDNYASVMTLIAAVDTNRLYAPIPQQQIDANKGVLIQNPGY
ncbi:MAG: RagB/SusD family nutrient uptake outer membrane protein [Bacteroidales bacterium]